MTKFPKGMRRSLLGAAALAFALLNAGCGGTSTAKSSATPSSPYAIGISDATGAESSGLGLPASVSNPSASDVAYYTNATAVTPLGSSPPINANASGATPAVPLGGAVPASQAGVTFRADIANGVTADGSIPKITGVVLSSTDAEWTLGTLPLTFQYTLATANGPYVNATYTTAAFNLPFTTAGGHTVSVTVTDTAGRSTRTDYVVQVATAAQVSVIINNVDTGTTDTDGSEVFAALAEGDTATLTPTTGTAQTATADASGTAFFLATPGTYTLTVLTTDADGNPITYTQTLDLSTTAAGGTFSQVKVRAGAKLRASAKAHTAIKARH